MEWMLNVNNSDIPDLIQFHKKKRNNRLAENEMKEPNHRAFEAMTKNNKPHI